MKDEVGSPDSGLRTPPCPRRSWPRRLGRFLLAVLLIGCAAEVLLRLFWGGYYLDSVESPWLASPTRGYVPRPNIESRAGAAEYVVTCRHNAMGWRDRDYPKHKPDDVYRILCVGDSFTYGVGVEQDQVFPDLLEHDLKRAEVVNAGVIAYGSGQQMLLLEEEGLAFEPDLVLVMFLWNDISDNCIGRVRFRLDGEALTADVRAREPSGPSVHEWFKRHVFRHSYLYRFTSDQVKHWRFRLKQWLRPPGTRMPLDQYNEAWRIQEAILVRVQHACREARARLLVAIIPDLSQVNAAQSPMTMPAVDIDVQERMREICRRHAISVLDLLPAFREKAGLGGDPLYYAVDWHWTPAGHRVAATAIRRYLLAHVPELRDLQRSAQAVPTATDQESCR